mmetsp:Transcript_20545/g.58942  ORF Transcript_20545/g.58942 Transcript_20545/m.58942 type:complete len:296 (+) Transcript_20545:599-1486(+)
MVNPFNSQTLRLGGLLRLLWIVGHPALLPMIVNLCLVGLIGGLLGGIGHTADEAQALVLELLAKRRLHDVVMSLDGIGYVGPADVVAIDGMLAEEAECFDGMRLVGHLVVIGEGGFDWRTNVVNIGKLTVAIARVRPPLVFRLGAHDDTSQGTLIGHVGEAGVGDVDQTNIIILRTDLVCKIRIWIVDIVLGNRTLTVDGEASRIEGILSRPPARLDDDLALSKDTATGGGSGSSGHIRTAERSGGCSADDRRRRQGDGSQDDDESRRQDTGRLERRGLGEKFEHRYRWMDIGGD